MKKLLLLWMAAPALALGIPVNLDGPNSDFSAFTSSGYRVEHSSAADPSAGLGRWWVSFFSAPGSGFDAQSFGGSVLNVAAGGIYSAVLVQGETVDGDYYSQIFRFKPNAHGLLNANLGENFSNLSWLRISGFGSGNDFALKDVGLNGMQNVPETGPGLLVLSLALVGLFSLNAASNRRAMVTT
jgi:hypothetical protein